MGDDTGDDWEKVREDWTRLAKAEYLKPNAIYDDTAQRRMASLIAKEAIRVNKRG